MTRQTVTTGQKYIRINNRVFEIVKVSDKSIWSKSPEGITFRESTNTFNTLSQNFKFI